MFINNYTFNVMFLSKQVSYMSQVFKTRIVIYLNPRSFIKRLDFTLIVTFVGAFSNFFFDTRTAWRAGVYDRPVRARWSGVIRSFPGWVVSNQSAASGTIRATWAGRENRTFLSFPVRARARACTCVENVRVPDAVGRCVAPDRRRRVQDF